MHGEAPGRLWKTSRSDHAYGSLKGIRLGVKLVTIVTVAAGWIDFHFDLHGAFLTADIDSDVYCHTPSGSW